MLTYCCQPPHRADEEPSLRRFSPRSITKRSCRLRHRPRLSVSMAQPTGRGRGTGPGRVPLAERKESRSQWGSAFSGGDVRRCPALPRGLPRSTIGAEGLNFRVRDGTGCFPLAVAAATLLKYRPGSRPYSGNRIVNASTAWCLCGVSQALGLLVPVSCTPCGASTSGLSTQSSGWGPYPLVVVGGLILRRASRLDAFSGYPSRT